MILLLKISLLTLLGVLVFTRYSHIIKILSGVIFIFLMTLINYNMSQNLLAILFSLIGVIYTFNIAKNYNALIVKRELPGGNFNFCIVTLTCFLGSYVLLGSGLKDPYIFALFFVGFYLTSSASLGVDFILGPIIFLTGVGFSNPDKALLSNIFLILVGIIGFFAFNSKKC